MLGHGPAIHTKQATRDNTLSGFTRAGSVEVFF